MMEIEAIYENAERRDIKGSTGPQILNRRQDEGNDPKYRGSRWLVLMTVSLGLFCVLLLVFIILQHITITAERDLQKTYKNTLEDFNQTISSLQDNHTHLMTEKHQLSQKKLELENKVKSLSEELWKVKMWSPEGFFMSTEAKNWSESRQYCRDHGGDLVIINTEEKQRFISSFVKERVWIGLTDIQQEGSMTWVDNSPLEKGFFSLYEPNDAGGIEDCVEMHPCWYCGHLNTWNDLPCFDLKRWICEK